MAAQLAAIVKAASTVEGATKNEDGMGFIAKAFTMFFAVALLFCGSFMEARAELVNPSLAGLPPWVTTEFLTTALEIQDKYGIYASVTIAQAQLEVGGTWNGSSLYATANEEHNYFGLKAVGDGNTWEGKTTWDGTAGSSGIYRKYISATQGLYDRARLLLTESIYADVAATAYGNGTSEQQLKALSESPWCENGYTQLSEIMNSYGLAALDLMSASDLSYEGNASVVARAQSMIGKCKYVWGACSASTFQFDCSGFVSWCLTGESSRLGTTDTFVTWKKVILPRPGDVVCYTGSQYAGGGHCGIYIGNDGGTAKMIDCSSDGGVSVRVVDPKMQYYRYG